MASKQQLTQVDYKTMIALSDPISGFVAVGAKSDGLYIKLPSGADLKLLTATANLTSLSGLSYVSASFVKMTAAGTFALDTATYLTSLSGALLATGATTGATSQSQTFTNGVTLSNLTASKVVFTDASKNLTSTGIGTSSQFIKGDGTLDSSVYLTSVTAHNLLSTIHGDTLADSVVRGDILIGNATPKWARLAKGGANTWLSSDGTDISWQSMPPVSGQQSKFSVNQTGHTLSVGDVIKSTGANTYGKAQADTSANAEVVGIVTVVTDSANFTYVTHGIIETGVPAQAAGTVIYLSTTTAGGLSIDDATDGFVSKPLLVILESSSKALFNNFRGVIVGGGSTPAAASNPGGTLYLYDNYGGF